MPEANSAPIHLNPPSRFPRFAPYAAQNPRLLNRLREALRSRHCRSRPEFRHGLSHLTHVDLFGPETSSYFALRLCPQQRRPGCPQLRGRVVSRLIQSV